MTNAQIIFNESLRLMEEGKIGTTGKQITVVNADGTKETINVPLPIHTYAAWKQLGFQVKKVVRQSHSLPSGNMLAENQKWKLLIQTELKEQKKLTIPKCSRSYLVSFH